MSKSFVLNRITFPLITFTLTVVVALFLATTYFVHQIHHAESKPFWGDETFGLEWSIREHGFADMLVRGAQGQGSPSPLDYMAGRILEKIKGGTNAFGMTDEAYYRLTANAVTTVIPIVIIFIYSLDILQRDSTSTAKCLQFVLLAMVPFAFYFTRMVHYYAAEARPYAMWNSLYFLVLASGMLRPANRRILFPAGMVCLALTATASIYQILTLAGAFIAAAFINGERLKATVKDAAKIFTLPLLVSAYYVTKVGSWEHQYVSEDWAQFWDIWTNDATIIAFMLVAIALSWIKRENRHLTMVPAGFLLLYLAGPALFQITKWKGFFFADRQYMYYDLANAVFLLAVVQCLPAYVNKLRSMGAALLIAVMIVSVGAATAFRKKSVDKMNTAMSDFIDTLARYSSDAAAPRKKTQ